MGARDVDAEIAFRKDYDLLPGYVILFKGFADYFFGAAIGVDVSLEASEESLAIWSKMQRRKGGREGVIRYPMCSSRLCRRVRGVGGSALRRGSILAIRASRRTWLPG